MFKSTKPNRLIIIIFWLILIFIAIVKLPSISNLTTDLNEQLREPSQISQSEQLINSNRLQRGWGRRLGHTTTADVVYNERNGKITDHQQKQIDQRVRHLQKHASEYGIQKITDLNTDRNGSDELKSHDNSTELIQLSVGNPNQGANANIWANEIKGQMYVPTLRSSVTSPQLLKAASVHHTVHLTAMITVIGLVLSSMTIGFIFKSLIVPIISLITLLITDLISLSLAGNLAKWTGFNEFTPLAILLVIITVGTIMTYLICQAIINELPNHRDANNAVQQGLRYIKRPIELSGLILTVAFGAAIMIPEANVRLSANLGITFAVLTLAEITLIPTFIAWLGSDILWPSHHYNQPNGHKLWNRLTRLSLWQPLIGIIAVIYFIVPFAYSYRNNFNYQQSNNVPTNNQAYKGSNELNAHFTAGKSTPVTIYLRSPQKFNREPTLRPVDDLTNKLQSMPGVNAVYSVTQPSGMPINKYYVNHQLNVINSNLNQNQNKLYRADKSLGRNHKKLSHHQLQKIRNGLNKLSNVRGQIPRINLNNQLNSATGKQKATINSQLSSYNSQLQDLNSKLDQLDTELGNINTINNDVKTYQHQIKAVNKQISSTQSQIKKVNGQLNDIYGYLSSLQRSSASHQYFITPGQIEDTDFQQSLINFTSQDERITKLQVIFDQAPSTRYNQSRIRHLISETHTTLQGTPLSHAKVAFSGVPVEQATIHKNAKLGLFISLVIITSIVLLGLSLISRSIFNPLFWLISFGISSLAGFQITELIVRYTTNQAQFNWQILLPVMTTLIGVAIIELVPLSLSYRHRSVDLTEWLHETFTSLGQNVTTILIIVTLTPLSLFFGMSYQFAQISLIVIITTIIFNWTLPLLASALGKYLKTLPHSRI
ncbi:MMPL family transporter [Acetilactobacillus jinshanensis]|uniref:Membrane transport protein MMPL domain-containing protein n=1 Tax=Acetilactobacillus jinshanensis TaxID=1720083 RepID=A0A4P6ZMF7_9LACO|nr:MMPL family transporter [Acetilactobacillus jinshanensis]QBP18908.1 hypothetical protein ELX58_07390 [Acetilactobacillus jinshanensis]URL60542.1 MMPL family transporter [uncultured bacterium]